MTEQQKANLKLAVADLKSNPLKAKGAMRDDEGGRCCLCVMAETAERINGVCKGSYSSNNGLPHAFLSEMFGLENSCIQTEDKFFNFYLLGSQTAAECNDGVSGAEELSHSEIAAIIEERFLK